MVQRPRLSTTFSFGELFRSLMGREFIENTNSTFEIVNADIAMEGNFRGRVNIELYGIFLEFRDLMKQTMACGKSGDIWIETRIDQLMHFRPGIGHTRSNFVMLRFTIEDKAGEYFGDIMILKDGDRRNPNELVNVNIERELWKEFLED